MKNEKTPETENTKTRPSMSPERITDALRDAQNTLIDITRHDIPVELEKDLINIVSKIIGVRYKFDAPARP